MVEVKELAILFKRRVDQESGDTTFIPYRIIEGCYDEDNEVFIDKDENSYHHIVLLSLHIAFHSVTNTRNVANGLG